MGARVVQAPSHPLACDTSHPLQGSPDHKSSPIVDRSIGALPSPQPPTPLHHPPPSSLPSQSTPEPNQPSSQSSAQRPQPPPKLTLCPTMSSNGLTPELANALDRLQPSLSPSNPQPSTRRGLWGMFGEAQPSRSSARSPDLDLDSLSVRSDDSGESSWTDMGDSISVAMEGDASIGEGLFRVERDNDGRLGGDESQGGGGEGQGSWDGEGPSRGKGRWSCQGEKKPLGHSEVLTGGASQVGEEIIFQTFNQFFKYVRHLDLHYAPCVKGATNI